MNTMLIDMWSLDIGTLRHLQDYYKKMFGMKRLRYRDQPDVGSVCAVDALLRHCFGYVWSLRCGEALDIS